MAKIPRTEARLKPYVKVRFQPKQGGTEIEAVAVQSVDISIEREAHVWRQFNEIELGKPHEVVPGLPSYSLTLEKVVLRAQDAATLFTLIGRTTGDAPTGADLKKAGYDVMEQVEGINILVQVLKQDAPDATPVVDLTLQFTDCWATAAPLQFNVTEDETYIVQEIEFVSSGIIVT